MTTAFLIGCVGGLLVGLGLGRELKWACCECDRREARERRQAHHAVPGTNPRLYGEAPAARQNWN